MSGLGLSGFSISFLLVPCTQNLCHPLCACFRRSVFVTQSVLLECAHLNDQTAAGDRILQDIHLSLAAGRYGLCGRNGSGKSRLLTMLAGKLRPTQGDVRCYGRLGWLPQQQTDVPINRDDSVADFLNLTALLEALLRVEAGCGYAPDFELIGDDWNLPARLQQILPQHGFELPPQASLAQLAQCLQRPLQTLSGGERMRLQLALLFAAAPDVLLLDEPGNHLDSAGQQWLLQQIAAFRGLLILVSHERPLLQAMEHILELRGGHLHHYGGHYGQFIQQRRQEQDALQRQLEGSRQRLQQVSAEAQRSQEKAARRAQSGKRERRDGSQSKLLLDKQQQSAEQQQGRQSRLRSRQSEQATAQLRQHQQQWLQDDAGATQWYLPQAQNLRRGTALQVTQLPWPVPQAAVSADASLTFSLQQGERCWLHGANGSGKSTLLTLLATVDKAQQHIQRRVPVQLLDQHCRLLQNELSVLDNLQQFTSLNATAARTLLAGVGLSADVCLRPAAVLSGGERMKLALLMVTQQTPGALLLLDEPDNHLDMHSREQLAQALCAYQGAMILVSHDKWFAAACGVTQTLKL